MFTFTRPVCCYTKPQRYNTEVYNLFVCTLCPCLTSFPQWNWTMKTTTRLLFRDKNLTLMFTLARRVQLLHLKARVIVLYGWQNGMKLSTWCIRSIYVSLWDLRLLKLNVFWLKHLLQDWFVSRGTSWRSKKKGQITLKCSVNFPFPKIHFICCPVFWKYFLKA